MKILSVVGARPNFMKVAPIIAAIHRYNAASSNGGRNSRNAGPAIEHILVHTGQHYDARMSDSFFADLNLPEPDVQLGVGSGSQSLQTAEVLKRFESVLLRERPDVVIVVGDVNSSLACALATAKISFDSAGRRPLLAHVEAGLRSFDRSMPEEINRVVTDHVSDLFFVTEPSAVRNLHNEGIPENVIHFVGNTMIDSLLAFRTKAENSPILERLGLRQATGVGAALSRYGLLTLHRPSNVDERDNLRNILDGLEELAASFPIVFPVHPRTQTRIREFGLEHRFAADSSGANGAEPAAGRSGIIAIQPLGYLDFLHLMQHAEVVVTDSGGIQEETTCLGIPCVTVRENTERPITVEKGTNIIAGTAREKIAAAVRRRSGRKGNGCGPEKWDGQAARRIVEILAAACQRRSALPEPATPSCAGVSA